MEWMFMPLKRYAEFNGRSRRMEYWMFQLGLFLLGLAFMIVMLVVGVGFAGMFSGSGRGVDGLVGMFASMGIMFLLMLVVFLALFIPGLAVQVRRLHDTNRSGWWVMLYYGPYLLSILVQMLGAVSVSSYGEPNTALMLFNFVISLVWLGGWITLAVFDCLPGTSGPNRFGPDPMGGSGNFHDLSQTFQ